MARASADVVELDVSGTGRDRSGIACKPHTRAGRVDDGSACQDLSSSAPRTAASTVSGTRPATIDELARPARSRHARTVDDKGPMATPVNPVRPF